jgi:hypothetical protein
MGVIDLSRGLAERFALQAAVNQSLELIQARPAVAGATATDVDYSWLKTKAASLAKVPVAQVTLNRWLECDGVDKGDVNGTCTGTQDVARYLQVRINKNFEGEFYFDTIPMSASGALRTQ